MKILQLANKIPFPPKDGGAVATTNLSKGLNTAGNEIVLLAMNTKKHYVDQETAIKSAAGIKLISIDVDTDIKCHKALLNFFFSRKPYNAERFIQKKYADTLKSLLQRERFDIIQLEGLYLLPYIHIIRKYSDSVVSYRAHNIEHEIWQRIVQHERNVLKKIYLNNLSKRIRNFEIFLMDSYDIILPITRRDADMLHQLGNTKACHVVPCGIEIHDKPEFPKKQQTDLFHLGALDWTPNQEGLIWFLDTCWPAIVDKNPDATFFIAGRNAPINFIKKISVKNVVYCGEVDSAEQFIKEHDIMIVPLLSGSGMRVKIIEGMLFGKTVVTTNIGAEGIPVTHGKNIIIANSPAEFINNITHLLQTDSDRAVEIGMQAYDFITNNFDNFAICEKLHQFYQTCLSAE